MPYACDVLSATELGALIEVKLREHPVDLRPRHDLIYDDELSLDGYRALVVALMNLRRHKLEDPRYPSELLLDLHVHLGTGWQDRPTDALDDQAVERNFDRSIWHALQRYRDHYLTSETWRREIAAIDRSDDWLALAAEHEAAGRLIQANAALAAARWLDPATAGAAAEIVRGRPADSLPARLLAQPQPGFRDQCLERRHWLAWDMKNHGLLDVPSLITYACDESFWVRTRIYRSLGQQPLVAAVPVLLEGLLDPHDFARAQAVRSLGWIGAPTPLDRLQRLASEDASAEVRRSAKLAAQRIVGYWIFYGEWRTIVGQPRRRFEVVRQLASRGLGGFAHDLLDAGPVGDTSRAEYDAIANELEPFSLDVDPKDPTQFYDYHVHAAREFEDAIARADPDHEPDTMLALYAVSKQCRPSARAADLVSAPEPLGWNARRARRALSLA